MAKFNRSFKNFSILRFFFFFFYQVVITNFKTRISYYVNSLFSSTTSALQLEVTTKKRTIKLVLPSKIKATLLQQITFLRRILSDSSFWPFILFQTPEEGHWGRSSSTALLDLPDLLKVQGQQGGGVTGKLRMEKWLSLRKQLMELSVDPEESEGSPQTHIHPIIMRSSHDITHLMSRCFLVFSSSAAGTSENGEVSGNFQLTWAHPLSERQKKKNRMNTWNKS